MHISLLIFLLLIVKVPVNQGKEKLAKNVKYLKLIFKAYWETQEVYIYKFFKEYFLTTFDIKKTNSSWREWPL